MVILVGQDGAIALGNAITNNKMLKELLLANQYDYGDNDMCTVDKESAMIIIKSLYNNNTITKLSLAITLHKDDTNLVTEEAEKVISTRKLSNNHIIDFTLDTSLTHKDNIMLHILLNIKWNGIPASCHIVHGENYIYFCNVGLAILL